VETASPFLVKLLSETSESEGNQEKKSGFNWGSALKSLMTKKKIIEGE
jgi:hypothetical protein